MKVVMFIFAIPIFILLQSGYVFAKEESQPTDTTACKTEFSKTWFENIQMVLSLTGVIQGIFGAQDDVNPDGETVDANVSGRLELNSQIDEHGSAYMLVEFGKGDGIDSRIGTFTGFNETCFDDDISVSELLYERFSTGDKWRMKIGHIDVTRDFDNNAVANCECTQFLSPGFVYNLAVEFPDDNGPGAMLWVKPNEKVDLGFTIADADADWDDVFNDLFCMVEADFNTKMKCGEGMYRFYGWLNAKSHEKLMDEGETSSGQGFGFSFDQALSENVMAFARFGWEDNDVYDIGTAFSSGVNFTDEKENILGLAYGIVSMSDDRKHLDLLDGIASGNEHHVEIYYSIKINDKLYITPDFQWIRNVGAVTDNGDAWALGLRAHLVLD